MIVADNESRRIPKMAGPGRWFVSGGVLDDLPTDSQEPYKAPPLRLLPTVSQALEQPSWSGKL
jgi:hypothetical protein